MRTYTPEMLRARPDSFGFTPEGYARILPNQPRPPRQIVVHGGTRRRERAGL